jgi:hypothetical protein
MSSGNGQASAPLEPLVGPDFIGILNHSFEMERYLECGTESRLVYLSDHIFDFTTYDSEMSEMFSAKAVEVCDAINNARTFDYIANAENYKWFLVMCNMPFFAQRLNWGTSIRGAWWDHREHRLSSCGIWNGDEQEMELKFRDVDEWKRFIAAIVAFAGLK